MPPLRRQLRHQLHRPHRRRAPLRGRTEPAAFLDLGIYGIPQRIKDGDERFDTVTRVRRFEERVRDLGDRQFMLLRNHGTLAAASTAAGSSRPPASPWTTRGSRPESCAMAPIS